MAEYKNHVNCFKPMISINNNRGHIHIPSNYGASFKKISVKPGFYQMEKQVTVIPPWNCQAMFHERTFMNNTSENSDPVKTYAYYDTNPISHKYYHNANNFPGPAIEPFFPEFGGIGPEGHGVIDGLVRLFCLVFLIMILYQINKLY